MTRTWIALTGLILLTGCSGGGGEEAGPATQAPQPPSAAQPDMLTATSQGLLRGKANGQGQRLIFSKPDMHLDNVFVDGNNVVYRREAKDIWTVKADGTGDRALLNTPDEEFIAGVNGPWLIYLKYTNGRASSSYGSLNIETMAQHPFDDGDGTNFLTHNPSRMLSVTGKEQISSVTVTGTDRLTYATLTPEQQQAGYYLLGVMGIVGDRLTYSLTANQIFPAYFLHAYTIPLTGGVATPLDNGSYNTYSAWSIGTRVVYHRCFNDESFSPPCDVASIQNDGSNRVILTTHPANEAVQGVIGNQVIIRRNLAGNDHLIAVPVTGGTEKLLMTMNDDEFVVLVVDDVLILKRPSGTWSLDLNGKLTKLGTVSAFDAVAVGDAVCVTPGAVWCMPLDASSPAVKIADTGKVVGVL